MKHLITLTITLLIILTLTLTTSAYTITNIKATCSHGQVFITWNCPSATGLKYNVYRSSTKFTDVSQLNSSTYIGNVRDSSCKNIRLSQQLGQNLFFKIIGDTALHSNQGLYVFTCTANASYYYCVTITKLSSGVETKKVKGGKTSLKKAIAETVADPQPIEQDSLIWNDGEHVTYYAWFVNNIDAPNFPAMCSQGSYGYNFYLIRRGNAPSSALFAFYEGLLENSIKGNGIDSFSNVTNCYILGFDDWIPTPNGNTIGENTFWCGYHEHYDMYNANNAIPTTGVVKVYSQKRYIQSILWARKNLAVDTNKVYVVGISAGGMGAYLTANLIPDKITYAYCIVGDFKVITIQNNNTQPEQMWGDTLHNISSDVLNPETLDTIHIFNLFDERQMFHYNRNQNMPLIQCVYGKNDLTIPWTPLTIGLIDSLNNNRIGGLFFWDQRGHDGSGKNFNDEETMPDWYSFSNNIAYPAFSNCSINANPGDGIPSDGASLGVINGYLDYDKASITDQHCEMDFNLSVKNLFVGGILYSQQYDSCTADVTIRRAQDFHPVIGSTIKWKVFDSSNVKIQSGSLTYNGGLLTVPGVQIKKSGCRLQVKISSCIRDEDETETATTVKLLHEGNNYSLLITSAEDDEIQLSIVDLAGRILLNKNLSVSRGSNVIPLENLPSGISIASIRGRNFSQSEKLFVQ